MRSVRYRGEPAISMSKSGRQGLFLTRYGHSRGPRLKLCEPSWALLPIFRSKVSTSLPRAGRVSDRYR